MMSGHLRPHFFIIGERKCGTSSLYRYLLEHPQVLPGHRKELQFFTQGEPHIAEHFDDYLRCFPRQQGQDTVPLRWPELDGQGILFEEDLEFSRDAAIPYFTGEASADTFSDVPPATLHTYLPALRLIVLLRDPVQRAFSHHRMLCRFRDEGRSLAFEVTNFESDMRNELAAIKEGRAAPLLEAGLYLPKLKDWTRHWGASSLLVLFCEHLRSPQRRSQVMKQVFEHLGLPAHQGSIDTRYNEAPPKVMRTQIRKELEAFYRPHDAALQEILGCPLPW